MRWVVILFLSLIPQAFAANVFIRVRVTEPAGDKLHIVIGGWRHADPWRLPRINCDVAAGQWSDWQDLSNWPLHGRLDRAGGIAEWPAGRVTVSRASSCKIHVQLADKADEAAIVHNFTESSGGDTIAFLLPTPLREHANEFETGSQMTARHLGWAKQAAGAHSPTFKEFTFITSLWGHPDPLLAAQSLDALRLLGFNIVGNADSALLRERGMRTYQPTRIYQPDPAVMEQKWKVQTQSRRGKIDPVNIAHFVLSDEVKTLNFVNAPGVDGWFAQYLKTDKTSYPAKAMLEKSFPRDADLETRKLMYQAAKFGHYWSARQLRHNSDLIRTTFPGAMTETLPSDHGFLNASGPPHIGMSYRMLDLFELGAQRSVDQLSAEDWLGLNHMYGPAYTWTGAQTFEYFAAIGRSATQLADEPMMLRGLITPSDDAYLRLKAYSGIGQGMKSIFFWTFGPTYTGTENYWSDLRSEYDGIAKLGRAIELAEPVLMPAKPVRDPVAILYSVSHDIWHTDNPAAFVEKRLLWHALRHLHVQPDFLREEQIESGALTDYKVLYIADWCITRAASAKIDEWIKSGGVVYLSAGAATRDEYYEPYLPGFAAQAWCEDAAVSLKTESHRYNERVDLETIAPMTTASVFDSEIPVLGCRLDLNQIIANPFARFADQKPAGAVVDHGKGKVIALGFLPMLAYAQGANFKPTTLEEKWPTPPRRLPQMALDAAKIQPVARCDLPVVETSLLSGKQGSALVLVNYTYQPIDQLTVDLTLAQTVARATSTEGVHIDMEPIPGGVRLRLPLTWADLILLESAGKGTRSPG